MSGGGLSSVEDAAVCGQFIENPSTITVVMLKRFLKHIELKNHLAVIGCTLFAAAFKEKPPCFLEETMIATPRILNILLNVACTSDDIPELQASACLALAFMCQHANCLDLIKRYHLPETEDRLIQILLKLIICSENLETKENICLAFMLIARNEGLKEALMKQQHAIRVELLMVAENTTCSITKANACLTLTEMVGFRIPTEDSEACRSDREKLQGIAFEALKAFNEKESHPDIMALKDLISKYFTRPLATAVTPVYGASSGGGSAGAEDAVKPD